MHPIQSDQPQGKLHFKAFRENHFGPEKVYHWNSLFFPNGNQWRSTPQDVQQQHVSQNQSKRRPREVENEKKINKRARISHESRKSSKHNESKLSEQAIEIFRFSEAWKREKAQRLAEQEKEDGLEKKTMFPESSAAHLDGTEPPATSLVLSNTEPIHTSPDIAALEHLVNFTYTSSCNQDTVLWPVLPLRL
ncbi:hypothetical protein INT44_008122 [Umbelopsis vinacea]|uniref:Uncharacterized protein n=1 Tax=Umbelopsis vinacea TaxID=44442 RepID=A0A8H7PPL3_9FUNG|nr:hypothetical protein INT44_008122 [Umbelopsis vinacea]